LCNQVTKPLLYSIEPPAEPMEWSAYWSKAEIEAEFANWDQESESNEYIEHWWQDSAFDRWEKILEPIEDKCLAKCPGETMELSVLSHAPVENQILTVLTQFDGDIANGGVIQWIGNHPLLSLAVPQALRMIRQNDIANMVEIFAWAELSDAENHEPFQLAEPIRLLSEFPERAKKLSVHDLAGRDSLAIQIDQSLFGPDRECFALAMRNFAIESAERLPREPIKPFREADESFLGEIITESPSIANIGFNVFNFLRALIIRN
jgi:hypothetical protein